MPILGPRLRNFNWVGKSAFRIILGPNLGICIHIYTYVCRGHVYTSGNFRTVNALKFTRPVIRYQCKLPPSRWIFSELAHSGRHVLIQRKQLIQNISNILQIDLKIPPPIQQIYSITRWILGRWERSRGSLPLPKLHFQYQQAYQLIEGLAVSELWTGGRSRRGERLLTSLYARRLSWRRQLSKFIVFLFTLI